MNQEVSKAWPAKPVRIKNYESRSKNLMKRENPYSLILTPYSRKGYTLVEILIVVFIFAILMFVTISSLSQTLKGSKKSENQVKARQNVDYTISTMERLIRNARSVSCPNQNTLSYVDEYENAVSFRCLPIGSTNGYIASGSARLTNTDISVNCSLAVFVCSPGGNGVPPSVRIVISGKKAGAAGSEESNVKSETTVLLRTYE